MIPEFALRLICGLATTWCLLPRRQITSGFFRIQMLLGLGLSVLACVTANQWTYQLPDSPDLFQGIQFGIAISIAFLTFAGSVAWTLERRRGGFLFAILILLFSTAGILFPTFSHAVSSVKGTGVPAALQGLDALSSAWILGTVTSAMLLGHWYLTATGMVLNPLISAVRLFGIAVLIKIATTLMITLFPGSPGAGNWPMTVLRWGGLFGPLVMAGLTLQILKYRNTQSATGVLYAATILVFMGEMAARLQLPSQAN